jgi:hypothetical protein
MCLKVVKSIAIGLDIKRAILKLILLSLGLLAYWPLKFLHEFHYNPLEFIFLFLKYSRHILISTYNGNNAKYAKCKTISVP